MRDPLDLISCPKSINNHLSPSPETSPRYRKQTHEKNFFFLQHREQELYLISSPSSKSYQIGSLRGLGSGRGSRVNKYEKRKMKEREAGAARNEYVGPRTRRGGMERETERLCLECEKGKKKTTDIHSRSGSRDSYGLVFAAFRVL